MNNRPLAKFFVAAALFFIWVTVQGALQAQRPVHDFLEQGPAGMIVGAHAHVGTLGWVSLSLMGALYYLVPLVSGRTLSWPRMVNWVFWVGALAFALSNLLLITAGIRGGAAFAAGAPGPQIGAMLAPYMMTIGIVSIIAGLVAIVFSVQIIHTATKKPAAA